MTDSLRTRARRVGLLYLLMAGVMILAFMYIPGRFVVSGDAAATARNILAGQRLYSIGILAALLSHIMFVFVALALYDMFRDVDRKLARLVLVLVCVGVAAELANIGNRAAPLALLSNATHLDVFTRPQVEALALTFLRLNNSLGQLLMSIWGLWLFPFGMLVIKSGWFPRIFGYLLFIAGAVYILGCIMRLATPAMYAMVSPFMFPLAMGELGIVFWMAFAGAKEARTV